MAKKPKKLNVAKVEEELRLLAAGANGGTLEPDGDALPDLLHMGAYRLRNFVFAVADRWFDGDDRRDILLMDMYRCDRWQSYATLAEAIVEERLRLDQAAAAEDGTE